MKKIIIVALTILCIIGCMVTFPIVSAAYLPTPSPHKVADKPVKYTGYQSYLDGEGTVRLRKYIKAPTLHYKNPYEGKKIKSIYKKGASDEQNYWIQAALIQCGSLDAVLMVEAESGWGLNAKGATNDYGLFQWHIARGDKRYKRNNDLVARKDFYTWSVQVKEGCQDFRQAADVNDVLYSERYGDWRSRDGMKWHGMANSYSPGVLNNFVIETE